MPKDLTPLAKTVDALLREKHGVGLLELVESERELRNSFRSIAERINRMTGGAVEVSGWSVSHWYSSARPQKARAKKRAKKAKGAAA